MQESEALLKVNNLSISFNEKQIIHNVSFSIKPNTILGVVGESGSGKSVTSMAIMGLLPNKITKINSGEILYNTNNILEFSKEEYQRLRGNNIGMIFQEPMSALNPSMRCGKQVAEVLQLHLNLPLKKAKNIVMQLFTKVKLPNVERIYNSYPHELSGGQKQRIVIAMAIACKPALLIADEPTTALDVTVQKEIIELLKMLQQEYKMSIIFISHDLNLVSEIANETLVMYQGKILEHQKTDKLFFSPKTEYTKALITSRPNDTIRLKRLPTVSDYINNQVIENRITQQERKQKHIVTYAQKPLLRIESVSKIFTINKGWFSKKQFKAVDNVSFSIYEGETLGLVGESGCGKSTLGNLILNLTPLTKGTIFYKDKDISQLSNSEMKTLRKDIQLIFQDPFASLNPKITIGKAIMEPMIAHQLWENNTQRKHKVLELLKRVGLDESYYNRYPHEFSGGQRQRIGIARTIALQPKLIVCDESVSALDISVQAQVLNLLNELKENYKFTYLFISHDLSVVKYMADNLLVMKEGKIVESGEADYLYNNPKQTYTQQLIGAIPKAISND